MGDWELGHAGGADEATAAVVAHQLLTPLSVIVGMSVSLREKWHDVSDEDRLWMLNSMEASAKEAAQRLRAVATGCLELLV